MKHYVRIRSSIISGVRKLKLTLFDPPFLCKQIKSSPLLNYIISTTIFKQFNNNTKVYTNSHEMIDRELGLLTSTRF